MQFDPENPVVKLCARGMELEGQPEEAAKLFNQAWYEATNNLEKFIAAHYVARHQNNIPDKLKWDKTALELAMEIDDNSVKGALPSLYLNIAKCYEDMDDVDAAKVNYELGLSLVNQLQDDGYGNLIKNALENGRKRVGD